VSRFEIHQKDANAEQLKTLAEQLGMTVEVMQRPVDYLVGYKGLSIAVEIKTEKGKLRPSQVAFFDRFRGAAAIWRTANDVMLTHQQLQQQARTLRSVEGFQP
jgi:hypothetical protein